MILAITETGLDDTVAKVRYCTHNDAPSAGRRARRLAHGNAVGKRINIPERRKLILRDHRTKLWAYMAGVCSKEKIVPLEIGGMDDHAHLLIQLPPTLSLSDAVQEIKTSSSRWMGKSFAWQRGFAAFSVSASNKAAVVRYIRTQDAHHKKMDYVSELIALLKKHGVPYDPKYVFD